MEALKGERTVSCGGEMAHLLLTKVLQQPNPDTNTTFSPWVWTHPLLPLPPFPPKDTASSDITRWKLHVVCRQFYPWKSSWHQNHVKVICPVL